MQIFFPGGVTRNSGGREACSWIFRGALFKLKKKAPNAINFSIGNKSVSAVHTNGLDSSSTVTVGKWQIETMVVGYGYD